MQRCRSLVKPRSPGLSPPSPGPDVPQVRPSQAGDRAQGHGRRVRRHEKRQVKPRDLLTLASAAGDLVLHEPEEATKDRRLRSSSSPQPRAICPTRAARDEDKSGRPQSGVIHPRQSHGVGLVEAEGGEGGDRGGHDSRRALPTPANSRSPSGALARIGRRRRRRLSEDMYSQVDVEDILEGLRGCVTANLRQEARA